MRLLLALASTLLFTLACAGAGKSTDTAGDGADEYEGDEAGECTDGADNDRDGRFDCDDDDCASAPDCKGETDTDVDADTTLDPARRLDTDLGVDTSGDEDDSGTRPSVHAS